MNRQHDREQWDEGDMALSRSQITNTLLKLTPQNVADLREFERFKKWTPELMALRHGVNLSTAYRRLRRLVDVEALAVRVGKPLPTGGRERDIYYPTPAGARMITRLCDRGPNYVTAPDVSNPIDNVHDLAVLEITLRSGCFSEARAFQKRTLSVDGETLTIIPDAEFMAPDRRSTFFLEVEQTSRPEHIARKYDAYSKIFETGLFRDPWLVIGFPDLRTFRALYTEHDNAARSRQGKSVRSLNFFYVNLHELRARQITQFDTRGGRGWIGSVMMLGYDDPAA
jgi:hypothetical protein